MHLSAPVLRGQWKRVLICFLISVTCCVAADGDPPPGTELRTDHYILYVETLDAAETGRLLEAAYGEMKKFFRGVEPSQKLLVKIYATKERYQGELERVHRSLGRKRRPGHADGYYLRETACAYLYVIPAEYEMRRLLLHEVAHEYHDFMRPWSRSPSLTFCDEGLAEYFALHSWDGKVLRLGIVPPIWKLDYTKTALSQLHEKARFDLESIVAGDTELDYQLAWGLVSFLIDRHRTKFDFWRQGVDNGVEPRVVWGKQFGPVTPEFSESFEGWLKSKAPPWQVVSGEWCPAGESIDGQIHDDEFAVAILTQTPREFTVTLDSSSAVGGVVFGFHGAKSFHVLQHSPDGHWDVMYYERTFFPKEHHRTFPSTAGVAKATVVPGEGGTTLRFGGHDITVTNATGHVGLWVKEGRQRFRQ